MRKQNRAALSVALAVLILAAGLLMAQSASASELYGNWIKVGGGPADIKIVNDGIRVTSHTWYPANNGILYNEPVDLDGFSFEVTIHELAGHFDDGVDIWYAAALTNKKAYFDIDDPTQGSGVVMLLRAWSDGSGRVVFASLLEGEPYAMRMPMGKMPSLKPGETYRFELAVDDYLGLIMYVDGVQVLDGGLEMDLSWLKGVFSDDKAFFSFSSAGASETEFTMHKINDEAAIEQWKQEEFIISSFHPTSTALLALVEKHKEAGFNLLEMTFTDRYTAENALHYSDIVGINVLAGEIGDIAPRFGGFGNEISGAGTEEAIVDAIAFYGDRDSLYGYYVWDEPHPETIADAASQVAIFRRLVPDKLAFTVAFPSYWVNFQGGDEYLAYLDQYADEINLQVMSFDHYPFWAEIRHGTPLERSTVWRDMGYVRLKALEKGVPFWMYIQALGDFDQSTVADMTIEKIRLQAYYALAYGAKGISYYNTIHTILDEYARPLPLFEPMKELNFQLRNLGATLLQLESKAVYHTGRISAPFTDRMEDAALFSHVPDGLIIGWFESEHGDTYFLPVNRSYESPFRGSITFSTPVRVHEVSKETGEEVLVTESDRSLALALDVGEGSLFKVETVDR